MSEAIVKEVARQVLRGLDCLHQSLMVYMDIKPANILVFNDEPVKVKIADFALPRFTIVKESVLTILEVIQSCVRVLIFITVTKVHG